MSYCIFFNKWPTVFWYILVGTFIYTIHMFSKPYKYFFSTRIEPVTCSAGVDCSATALNVSSVLVLMSYDRFSLRQYMA